MNLNKLKEAYRLWKDISTFPDFLTLSELAKQYYGNSIRTVLCTQDLAFYDVTFTFEEMNPKTTIRSSHVDIETCLLFGNVGCLNDQFRYSDIKNYSKYNFTKNFKHDFLDYEPENKIIKWCLISELFKYLQHSVQ